MESQRFCVFASGGLDDDDEEEEDMDFEELDYADEDDIDDEDFDFDDLKEEAEFYALTELSSMLSNIKNSTSVQRFIIPLRYLLHEKVCKAICAFVHFVNDVLGILFQRKFYISK